MAKPTLYTKEMMDKYIREGYWETNTISDYWERNARIYPDEEAVVDSKVRLTWTEAKVWIDRLALGLLERGLKKDDVVVIQLPNCVELACLRVACERAGLLHLPAQRIFRQVEMEHILKLAGAKVVVIPWEYRGFNYYEMIKEMKPELPFLEHILIWGEKAPDGVTLLKEIISSPLERGYPEDYLEKKKITWNEFSLIGTTTGTTGMPKLVEEPIGAMLAGRHFIHALQMTRQDVVVAMSNAVLGPNAAAYLTAPMVAAKIVMLEHWSTEEALQCIEKERATVLCVLPTQLVELNAYSDLKRFNLSSLRVIRSAGAQMPYYLISELEDKLGCPILNMYGAVDFGGMSGSSIEDSREIRLLTVGRAYPGNEVKIVNDNEKEVPQGEIGRVFFRGAWGASGYYKDPETNAMKWTKDGWYITGDLGKIDEQGCLYIVGRGDDMIIRGGQNIMPAEVENLLLTHPRVKDAAIVGIPDPIMGERACACIVPKPDQSFSFDEMISFLKGKRIAPYKLPEKFLLFESLPYASGMKLDRKNLKAIAQKQFQ